MSDYFNKTPIDSNDMSHHFGLNSVLQNDLQDDDEEDYEQKLHLSSISDFTTTTPSLATPSTPMFQTPMSTTNSLQQVNQQQQQLSENTAEQILQNGPGITPQLQYFFLFFISYLLFRNVVSTVNLGIKLDLKHIALHARNAEYNPKRFAALIMRIREPKTTALIFASGKMVCTGAKSEEESR